MKLFLSILFFLIMAAPLPAQAATILWGVNGHPGGNPAYADYEKQFEIMRRNHLTTYRFSVALTEASEAQAIATVRTLIPLAKKGGIVLRPVLLVAFHWDDRTDAGHYKSGDPQALYRQGFDRTYNFVRLFKDDIRDWEMENEINLRVHGANGQPLFGYGWAAGEFDTPVMKDWSFVLKGMTDAVTRVNANYGTHLKSLIGTTSTNFGFIDYMKAHGVTFDILSYHYYVKLGESPYEAWSRETPPYDLFKKLASYGKPVRFTEANAQEIYDKAYANREDDGYTQKGYQSLNDILTSLKNQKEMNLEEVDVYELLDDPTQKGAEARFGLMYNLDSPKTALAIVRRITGP